jgi:hypothetical protein
MPKKSGIPVGKVLGRGEVWRGETFFEEEGLPSPRSYLLPKVLSPPT